MAIASKKTSLGVLTVEDILVHIETQLNNDYVLIWGEPKGITNLEYSVYLPNTPKNELFEAFMIPCDFQKTGYLIHLAYLGKKIPELRNLLHISNEEWNGLLEIVMFKRLNSNQILTSVNGYKGINKEKGIEAVINGLKSIIGAD